MAIKRKFAPKNKPAKKAKNASSINQSSLPSQEDTGCATDPKTIDLESDKKQVFDTKIAQNSPTLSYSDQNSYNKEKDGLKCDQIKVNEKTSNTGQKNQLLVERSPYLKVPPKLSTKNIVTKLAEDETVLSTIQKYDESTSPKKIAQETSSSFESETVNLTLHDLNGKNNSLMDMNSTKIESNQSWLASMSSKTNYGNDSSFKTVLDQNSGSFQVHKEKLVEPVYKEPNKMASIRRKKFKPNSSADKKSKKVKTKHSSSITSSSTSNTADTNKIEKIQLSTDSEKLHVISPRNLPPQDSLVVASPASNELVYSTLTTVVTTSSSATSNSLALAPEKSISNMSSTEISDQLKLTGSPCNSPGFQEPLKELENSNGITCVPALQEPKIQTRKKKPVDHFRKIANRKLNQHMRIMKRNNCTELPDFDIKEMTLTDMVYANPPKKHAKALGINKRREENEERKRRESKESSLAIERKKSQDESFAVQTQSSYSGAQLKLDANGEPIVEEASYHNPSDEEELTLADESKPINQNSFRKRKDIRSTRWSKEATEEFYDGLLNVGANFDLMSSIMLKYKDDQLRKKYKIERKKNPKRIDFVLNKHNKNLGDYASFVLKWSENNAEPNLAVEVSTESSIIERSDSLSINSQGLISPVVSSPELISSSRKLSR